MPYLVVKDPVRCPVSRPYAVYTETGHQTGKTKGSPHGCHTSRKSALKQAAAIYANVPDARSAAPTPPNLRTSASKTERCGLCRMYDDGQCWGYGNTDVRPDQVCDSFAPESETKSEPGSPEVHMTTTASPVLATNTVEWRRARASAISETQRKRPESRQVHEPLELREATEDGKRTLRSYASLFNEPYTVRSAGHRFQEVVRPGAFKRTLGTNPDVVFRTEHSGPPLAATWSKDLRLGEDERGLWYEVDLDESDPDVQSLISKVQRGVYRESSFAFRIPQNGDKWSEERDQREVMACELDRGDVSVVTFGASRGTGKHMLLRSEEEAIAALQEIGFKRFLEVFVEWRDFTLLPAEERIGKVISSQSMESLRQVLGLIADADDAVDEAEAMLADFLGVPNPDEDEKNDAGAAEKKNDAVESEERADPTMEDWGVMSALREAHLVLAHVKAKQLADPDNDKDPDDKAVMAQIVSAQDAIEKAIVAQSKDGRPDPGPADAKGNRGEEETPAATEERIVTDVPDNAQLIETALTALKALEVTAPPVEAAATPEAVEKNDDAEKAPDEILDAAVLSESGGKVESETDADAEKETEEANAEASETEEGEEYWLLSQDDVAEEDRADLSPAGRQTMAKAGTAMPDGSYPIPNVTYLRKAIQAFGRASDKPAVKAWIMRRAKALGATNLLPESWRMEEEPAVKLAENDSDDLRIALRLRATR